MTFDLVREDHNLVYCVHQNTIREIDVNSPSKPIFVSDKLSNMDGIWFFKEAKQFLIYNTSGHAYLYQYPEKKRISEKIFLKSDLLYCDGVAYDKGFCWFPDHIGNLRRVNLYNGKNKIVLKCADNPVIGIMQDKNQLFTITMRGKSSENPQCELFRYSITDGSLELVHHREISDYNHFDLIRRDFDGSTYVLLGENSNSWPLAKFLIFDADNARFCPIFTFDKRHQYGCILGFCPALEYDYILVVRIEGVQIFNIKTKETIIEYKFEYVFDALILSPHSILVSTGNGLYKLDF